jgi:DNA-binding NarL/FixJ family response regulator
MITRDTENGVKKKQIFIVDDHVILREGLTHLINSEDDLAVCGEAENVANALQVIAECKPDIAIVDITLEDGSGIRLIEDISHYHPGLPVLVLSMHDESIYAERCLRAGARGYIMKQEPSGKFISAIRKVLDGKVYVSDKLELAFIGNLFSKRIEMSAPPIESLNNRELELFQLIGQGFKKREIAEKMNLTVKTIENYTFNIKKKMDFDDVHDIITHAIQYAHGI